MLLGRSPTCLSCISTSSAMAWICLGLLPEQMRKKSVKLEGAVDVSSSATCRAFLPSQAFSAVITWRETSSLLFFIQSFFFSSQRARQAALLYPRIDASSLYMRPPPAPRRGSHCALARPPGGCASLQAVSEPHPAGAA